MNWLIYENGFHINTIYADEDYVKSYCERHGYTYEQRIDPEPEPQPEPEPSPAPSPEERITALTAAATAFALTAINIPDTQALDMVMLFPTWEDVLTDGSQLDAGRIINDGGQLYRVVQPVTPQANQAPHDDGMLAIYRPIEQEHAGTVDDPIPWVYGMDCYAGTYYSYNGMTYQVAEGGDMIPCVWAPDSGIWQWEGVHGT